jgi:hypothetical protein
MSSSNLSFGYFKNSGVLDLHYNANKLITELKSIPTTESKLEYIKDTCYVHGVNRAFETKGPKRIVLYANKNFQVPKGKRHTDFYFECNGIVICTNQWRIISYPNKKYSTELPFSCINKNLESHYYDIIKIYDGTIVTIYPYGEDKWGISSSSAFEMSTMKWMGDKNYATVLYDLFTRLYPEFVSRYDLTPINDDDGNITALNFAKLSRNSCYTIGFRHHDFHPLKSDPEKIWCIQSTNLEDMPIVDVVGPILEHIPMQTVINNKDIKTTDQIIALIGPNDYGYILRHINNYHIGIIESALMVKLRTLVYNQVNVKFVSDIKHHNRSLYNTTYAFLNRSVQADYIELFPAETATFERLRAITEEITKKIVNYLCVFNGSNLKTYDELEKHLQVSHPEDTNNLAICSKKIVKSFIDNNAINPFHGDAEKIVKDLVINPYHTLWIMEIL